MSTMPKPSSALLFGLAAVAAACQKRSNPPENAALAEARPAASAAASAEPARAPESTPPLASGPHAALEQAYPGQDQSVGKWVEASAYKFKVASVMRCADPLPGESVPEDRKVRVGAFVEVFSKFDQFFLTPRDVTLEKGGVILSSEREVKTSAECQPLLSPQHVQHDQARGGVVVFQVPDESFLKDGVVAFKPTRWGGAPRVEIKVSEVMAAKKSGK